MNLKRFTIVYAAVAVALIALIALVETLLGCRIANGGMSIIPAIVAALLEGQRYAKANHELPQTAAMWRFARLAALMILALSLIFVVVFSLVVPQLRQMMGDPIGAGVLFAGSVLQAGLGLVLVRFFIGMGAKSQMTAIRKQEERN